MLVPYKHYEAEIISGVLDGTVTQDDTDSEDYPCAGTMKRWELWLLLNLERIEGFLRNAMLLMVCRGYDFSGQEGRVFQTLREKDDKWLETTMRIVTDTGGRLAAVY